MSVDTSNKVTQNQVYYLVNKVGRAIDTCQDDTVECAIAFLYDKNEVHSLTLSLSKDSPLRSNVIIDVLKYLDNCDAIAAELKGKSGFFKEITTQPTKTDTRKDTTTQGANSFSGLGGLSGLLGGLGELSENKTGLGYIIAKSESASQIEAIRRDCDRQITEIEREAEKDRVYLNSQLQDRKYKITDLEREKRERETEVKNWKEKYEKVKEEKEKLEQAKKDFDSTKLVSDIGKQLLGVTTLFFNKDNAGEGAQMLNQGALGLIGGMGAMELKGAAEVNAPAAIESPYTPEKTNRISLLSSIGLFDSNENDFEMLYLLLKMVKEHPETFNNYIAKVMQKYKYILIPDSESKNVAQQPQTLEDQDSDNTEND